MNKWLPRAGLGVLLGTALALASVAAYMSVLGISELLAAIGAMAFVLAILVEWAKLVVVAATHLFWKTLKWWKWILFGIVGIQMAVTNIGVFSYLNSGYEDQKIPGQQIQVQLDSLDAKLTRHKVFEEEAVRELNILSTAEERYVDIVYIKRSQEYLQENAERQKSAVEKRDLARDNIGLLSKTRQDLVTKQEELAAKLGSIKHISSIASDANAKWIVLGFILLLVLSLDPLAVALVVLCSHFTRKWFIKEDTVVASLKPKIPPKDENVTVAMAPVFSKGVGDATKKSRAK